MVVLDEDVAALAYRTDDIVYHGLVRIRGTDVVNLVVCVIQGRTDEIGHACIDYTEILYCIALDIQYPADEAAALAYDGASQFEMQVLACAQLQSMAVCVEV